MPVNVRVYIYSCKNLPIADDDGSSDPFVVVWDLDKNKKQTKIINNSTNPQFYEAIDI
jgi:Ca2+-dependent lipid-binding protein